MVSKYVIKCIHINSLWKDKREAGNPDYLWEREGAAGGLGEGIGRETAVYPFRTLENCTMWMLLTFQKIKLLKHILFHYCYNEVRF